MLIAFDPAKDAINRTKHGVSLALAAQFDWLTGRVQPARTVDGESRWKLIVLFEGIAYSVIHAPRRGVLDH